MSFFQLVLLLVQLHVHKTQVLKLMNMNLYMGNMCIFLFNFATQNFLREMMGHPFPIRWVRFYVKMVDLVFWRVQEVVCCHVMQDHVSIDFIDQGPSQQKYASRNCNCYQFMKEANISFSSSRYRPIIVLFRWRAPVSFLNNQRLGARYFQVPVLGNSKYQCQVFQVSVRYFQES